MKKRKIFELQSLYRDNLVINGYEFGEGSLGVCVIGSLRGNEVQQLYVCSQLVKFLKKIEQESPEKIKKKIMIVPSANHYSLNIGERFWVCDHTDINRMFPGYDEGETVQRIADGIFKEIKDFPYGIQFTSNYVAGEYTPHIRIMKTGLEDIEDAKKFGMPYVVVRDPRPYDTTTLNYNWQIWDTKAFSIYTGVTDQIDNEKARMAYKSVIHFLNEMDIIDYEIEPEFESNVISDDDLVNVKTTKAGLFHFIATIGQEIEKGEVIAKIYDPFEGECIEELIAPVDGTVFFHNNEPMVYAKTIAYKVLAK